MLPSFTTDRSSPRVDIAEHRDRRQPSAKRAPRSAEDDQRARHGPERRARPRPTNRRDDGGFREYFAGPALLKSLDEALALPPTERNRAMARIVLGVDAGIDQARDTDCECMSPDLSALIGLMSQEGVDDATRESAQELADALQRLADHGGLDARRHADLERFADRLRTLPPAG